VNGVEAGPGAAPANDVFEGVGGERARWRAVRASCGRGVLERVAFSFYEDEKATHFARAAGDRRVLHVLDAELAVGGGIATGAPGLRRRRPATRAKVLRTYPVGIVR
jgi:hypothetical protein